MAFDIFNSGSSYYNKYQNYDKNKDLSKQYTYQEIWNELFVEGKALPKTLRAEHRVIVVDADAITYRVSAACEQRAVVAEVAGQIVEFPTKTKLKAYCEESGVDFDDVEYRDKVYVEPIQNCLSTLKKTVRKIYNRLDATHVIFFLGGADNFRLDLPLPDKYKGNRADMRRPEHLKACREYLNEYYTTYIVKNIEADDVVGGITDFVINHTDAWGCAYNLDKDFNGTLTPSRYYNPTDDNIHELGGGLGSIHLKKGKVAGEGLHWLLFQVMMGDPSDGFTPKKFFKVRFGDKGYYDTFHHYTTEKELLYAWVKKWQELLPEEIQYKTWEDVDVEHDWLSLANLYFKAPYMRTRPDDGTTFTDLLERYGLSGFTKENSIEGLRQGDVAYTIGDSKVVLL